MHLDVMVDDLDVAEAAVLALGARRLRAGRPRSSPTRRATRSASSLGRSGPSPSAGRAVTVTPAAPYVLARPALDDAGRLAELAATAFRETYLAANAPEVIEQYVAGALTTESYRRALADER